MSPEQARGDVCAAGVVLSELIAGERFWGGLSQTIWQRVGAFTFRPTHADHVDAVTGGGGPGSDARAA